MLHHSAWAREKNRTFVGRTHLVDEVLTHVTLCCVYTVSFLMFVCMPFQLKSGDGKIFAQSSNSNSEFAGVDLVIVGVSGTND